MTVFNTKNLVEALLQNGFLIPTRPSRGLMDPALVSTRRHRSLRSPHLANLTTYFSPWFFNGALP
ncbi:hypothetical protein B0F90DRAFT_1790311 [Multifurca ochricompacta]|uniref:Uncharacterized protein n=1 Tax=Multifurca ochricompacta TaxID=376703 RepID=A0AAD4LTU5_9AGAM|nr:hypothetical protein B0F90DRAFT_1790311 [Multifurca ochricompacta]